MIINLVFDDLLNIPRVYTAIAEWAACLIYIINTKRRIHGILFVFVAIAVLAAQILIQHIAGTLPLSFWILGMAVAVFMMFIFILICCDISPVSAGYWCARAFVLAEFVASFEWQIFYYLATNFAFALNWVVSIISMVLIYSSIFIGFYFLESRYLHLKKHFEINLKDFLSVLGIATAVFTISNISFFSPDSPFSGRFVMEIFYIRTLVDLCGVILLYSYQEQRLRIQARHDVSAMQNLLSRQYEQYCYSKESIELINRKYHDIKHQIGIIRQEKNPDIKAKYLDKMEVGIKMFEAQNKTGNNILDTVLTTKSMYCIENGINLNCVADGKLLDFMDLLDICSIMGNALDNAIESVKEIKDTEKRLINVAIYSQNQFVMIRISNYFENKLKYENGILTTTKKEKNKHGYGIKSIKASTEKYGGTVQIKIDNNWFNLCILIPLAQNEKTT